jgi:hypothetical protein
LSLGLELLGLGALAGQQLSPLQLGGNVHVAAGVAAPSMSADGAQQNATPQFGG